MPLAEVFNVDIKVFQFQANIYRKKRANLSVWKVLPF